MYRRSFNLWTFVLLGLPFLFLDNVCAVYVVPKPVIRIFRPRGFEVTIPYVSGLERFTFSANRNKPVSGFSDPREVEFSKTVLTQDAMGRMVVQDRVAKFRLGDKIYYQVVIKICNRDYTLSDQVFTVKANNMFRQPQARSGEYEEEQCLCRNIYSFRDDCATTDVNSFESEDTRPSPTTLPPPNPTTTEASSTIAELTKLYRDLDHCKAERLVLVQKVSSLQTELDKLDKDYAVLYSLADKLSGWKNFKLSGKISATDDPKTVVKFVLNEKLGITPVITSAVRNGGTILFSVDHSDTALLILQKTTEKLADSRSIQITNYIKE